MTTTERQPTLAIWTVYDSPTDYPGKCVARRYDIGGGREGPVASDSVIVMPDLEMIRHVMIAELHLTCLPREPGDDPRIVESWV